MGGSACMDPIAKSRPKIGYSMHYKSSHSHCVNWPGRADCTELLLLLPACLTRALSNTATRGQATLLSTLFSQVSDTQEL
ncbi:hypothetical protein Y1Q_0011769 [Alligator mississippiensis]|uniref:Uncharacterized protein n=1 Tax=Alligator mississippiensis TaxID=8496 RepID=A0A151M124_ALLMI|nr:hypothetical protein Y1Q_0011769 [Alligator mississippiensis]